MNRLLRTLALALLLSGSTPASADEPHAPGEDLDTATVTADQLELTADGHQLAARGNVQIDVADLRLRTNHALLDPLLGRLTLDSPFELHGAGLVITGERLVLDVESGRLEIDQPALELPSPHRGTTLLEGAHASCTGGRCRLVEASGTACPHQPRAYRIDARQVELHPSGDVDLSRPVLVVGDTRVAALPWLRVRPAGAAGLLPPRLGWDSNGGLVIGPAGQFPLTDEIMLHGHVAARTAQGMEARSSIDVPAGELTVFQLYDVPDRQHHARMQTSLNPDLRGARLALDVDLVDSYLIINNLTFDPLERAISHTASRALLATGTDNLLLETRVGLLQSLATAGDGDARVLGPTTEISLTALPRPLFDLLWPTIELAFVRHESLANQGPQVPPALTIPAHSKLVAAPSLAFPRRLGPLAVELRAASLHQLWLPDSPRAAATSRQLLATAAAAELPLVGQLGRIRHVITPLVRYRLTPWTSEAAPAWIHDGLERLTTGHGVEIGLRNALAPGKQPALLDIELAERFDLPGFGRVPGAAYLVAAGALGPSWLALRVEVAHDHRRPLPSTGFATLSSTDRRGNLLETGIGWYGQGRGPHLDGRWTHTTGPWLTSPWPVGPPESLALSERATAWFTRNWGARAGARIGIFPDPGLQLLWYGLELRSSCRCVSVGLTAAHRPTSWVPDVLATLQLLEY